MSVRRPVPPELVVERVLAPARSFMVRLPHSGALGVARRCAGRPQQLRMRLDALASAAPAIVVAESRLVEHENKCWAIRPWVHGRPLRDLRRDGPLHAREALRIASAVADAVAVLSARGLVHGRLHAANVILVGGSEIRIVDALDVGTLPAPGGEGQQVEVSLAPEILRGERAEPATDVYGLGLLLYEMLIGAHPFASDSAFESARRALFEQPDGWDVDGAALHRELVPILRTALAKRPGSRFKSVHQLISAVHRATVPSPAISGASEPPVSAPLLRRIPEAAALAVQRMRTQLVCLGDLRRNRSVRRAVVPALAAAALLAIGAVLGAWSRTSALEEDVESLLLAGDTARAAAVLRRQDGREEDVVTQKLLGDVSCARGEFARCLELYHSALEREPRFASNARLRRNTFALLGHGELDPRLRELLVRLEDVEGPLMAGTRHESYWRRWNSVRALEARAAARKVDYGVVYGLDVLHAGSCSTRQASLAKVVQLHLSSALPYLEQARRNSARSLFGDLCLGRDLSRAIRTLREDGQLSAGAR